MGTVQSFQERGLFSAPTFYINQNHCEKLCKVILNLECFEFRGHFEGPRADLE